MFFLLLTGAVLYGLSQILWRGKRSNLFTTKLLQVDTTLLERIVLHTSYGVFSLDREPGGWIASKNTLHLPAEPHAVNELLGALSGGFHTTGIVSQQEETWGNYGVAKGQGVRVQLYRAKAPVEDFVLGKGASATTFLRFAHQQSVYEMGGINLDIISRDFAAYRSPALLELKADEQITAFEWQIADTLLRFSKSEKGWFCNDSIVLDANKVAKYLGGLRQVSSHTFADDFDEVEAERYAFRTLAFTSNRTEEPYVVECFRDTLSRPVYFFRAGSQTEVFFAEDSTGLYRRLFKDLKDLITATHRQ